jgi:hypothetical protein
MVRLPNGLHAWLITLYRSKLRFGLRCCEYSLISPLRIFLWRTRAEAMSTTAGPVSVALGGRWPRL